VPHKVHERKFGRRTGARRGMLRNLTLSVLRYERVRRVGDSAPQMLLELVPGAEKPTAEKTDAAEEPKPRRRLALPRRRTAAKKDEPKAEANAKAAAKVTAPKKKKTAKGAAT